MQRAAPILLLAMLSIVAQAAQDNPAYRQFDVENLKLGRDLWLESCEGCHGYGTAGAPIPMQAEDWRARLQQAKQTLYTRAINGYYGPDDTIMPARGGNPDLTDEQVRHAVDYMAALARYHLTQAETTP